MSVSLLVSLCVHVTGTGAGRVCVSGRVEEGVATLAKSWEDSNVLSGRIGITASFLIEHRGQEDGGEAERRAGADSNSSPVLPSTFTLTELKEPGMLGTWRLCSSTMSCCCWEKGGRGSCCSITPTLRPNLVPCLLREDEVGLVGRQTGVSWIFRGSPPDQCSSCLPS